MIGKLTFKQKLLYGFGDVFGGGGFTVLGFLYTFYLTDVLGLNMIYIAPIMFIANTWDAVSDPLMGYISDNTKSKLGRRRPYFLYGPIFIFLAFTALWIPVDFNSQLAKFIYVLLAYLGFSTVFTMTIVPYFAYGAELTNDYNERTKLGTFRLVISLSASLIVVVTPLSIVNLFSNLRIGYFVMGAIYALMFALSVFSVFFVGKEKEDYQLVKRSSLNIFSSFKKSMKIKSFRKFVLIFTIGNLAIDTIILMMLYFVKYYIGALESQTQIFLGVAMITQLIFVPFWSKVAIKKSKSKAYVCGVCIVVITLSVLFFLPQSMNMIYYLLVIFAASIGLSAIIFIPHTMFPDVTDVGELAYGGREEGSLSGIQTFCRKLSKAVGLSIITMTLGLIGYQEPSFKGEIITQTETVITAIKVLITIVPIGFVSLAGIIAYKYPINKFNHKKLIMYLEYKNRRSKEGKLSQSELMDLKNTLI